MSDASSTAQTPIVDLIDDGMTDEEIGERVADLIAVQLMTIGITDHEHVDVPGRTQSGAPSVVRCPRAVHGGVGNRFHRRPDDIGSTEAA